MISKDSRVCCSSTAAMCYWLAASLAASGALSVAGIYWHPLHASAGATILLAMATGCAANWLRNRTFYCAITGPLFLIAGGVFLLSGALSIRVNAPWVWAFVFIGVSVAFLLEWRYARTSPP